MTTKLGTCTVDITDLIEEAPEIRPHIMTIAKCDFKFFNREGRRVSLVFSKDKARLITESPHQEFEIGVYLAQLLAITLNRIQKNLSAPTDGLITLLLQVR